MTPITAGAAPLDPPPTNAIAEARTLVAGMIADARGPYARIRWFCKDGSVQPPTPYACSERGGGQQHGEYSAARERLAALGYRVGTVFVALAYDELFDAANRHDRLRELALERYMRDIDDGWVMRRARDYRGHVQVEGEMRSGRDLLLRLYQDASWISANYLLAREAGRLLPHGDETDLMRSVRRLSQDLAAQAPDTEKLRVEVHTAPSVKTAAKYRRWAEGAPDATRAAAMTLAEDLDALFGPAGRRDRVNAAFSDVAKRIDKSAHVSDIRASIASALQAEGRARSMALVNALVSCRALIEAPGTSAGARIATFDLMTELEAELLVSWQAPGRDVDRRFMANDAMAYANAAFAVGLLSTGERLALHDAWTSLDAQGSLAAYRLFVQYLGRVPQWSAGTVRYTFAEPLVRYTALDDRAARFVDDVLRASPLVPLGAVTQRLDRDLHRLTGVGVSFFDAQPVGVLALNAGYATGKLVIYASHEDLEANPPARGDIVVIPETAAELVPVAGILTLGEGNPLSHVQLLARNFGIPNVAVAPDSLPLLQRHAGQRVMLAVSRAGSVVLASEADAHRAAGDLLSATQLTQSATLTVPLPDLSVRRPLGLEELQKSLSGRVVGPKAANLGELNRLFPGRVAPAIALPFGLFAEHTVAAREQLREAYQASARDELDEDALARRLAQVRADIVSTRLSAAAEKSVQAAMQTQFGEPGSYGVFVRSDTNVEDLPQFTGAGLSETIPNVVGFEAQHAAIARVWGSVLSPRAIAWRSNLLTNPEHVYASTLLMKSVPATKSGVLVTSNLQDGALPGLTVATAWGVGGAVAGEAAATLVLGEDDRDFLISEAKTPYQRRLAPAGGMEWLPAPAGPVLSVREKSALKALAAEVLERYAPVHDDAGIARPWDIEFGFVDESLTLFQIRPLVERGAVRADRIVDRLLRPAKAGAVAGFALDEAAIGEAR